LQLRDITFSFLAFAGFGTQLVLHGGLSLDGIHRQALQAETCQGPELLSTGQNPEHGAEIYLYSNNST